MDKHKQSAFWQRLTDLAQEQKIGMGWWSIILLFFVMSASTVLIWRSLLGDDRHQTNKSFVKLEAESVKPRAAIPATFAGSGVSIEITRLLAKQFQKAHPKIHINVPASISSSSAIQAVAEGAIAVATISRPLQADEKKLGLTVIPFARTPLAFAVNPSVVDNNITSAQLLAIYQGKHTYWVDGREIIVLTREPGNSAISILEQKISGFKQIYTDSQKNERWITLYKDRQMNQQLENIPLTLGLADVGTITAENKLSSIKTLKFNGVAPSIENVAQGKYPLVTNLYFVFSQSKVSPEAKKFIEFVRSNAGTKILTANSYLAVREEVKK